MGLIVGLNVIVDVIEESGDIGNTVVDLSLLSVDLYKHGHIAAAQVQIKFRNLTVLKVFQYFGILDELLGGRLGKQSRSQQQERQQKCQIDSKSLCRRLFYCQMYSLLCPVGVVESDDTASAAKYQIAAQPW